AYVAVQISGIWQAARVLGTSDMASSSLSVQVSMNANDDVAVAWQNIGSSGDQLQYAYTVDGAWQNSAKMQGDSPAESAAKIALDNQGNVQLVWHDLANFSVTNNPIIANARVNTELYYIVPSGATWASIAQTLYGASAAASALQSALGNPTLTVGL